MAIWEKLYLQEQWQAFLQYKEEKQHLSETEKKELEEYIQKKEYLDVLSQVEEKLLPLPLRKEINKTGASKKRVVYSFPKEFNYLLKLLTYCLQEYDELFGENCYAFRRNYGVKDAVKCLKRQKELQNKYCLKADISNYFNSVDVPILLSKLSFLREKDEQVYCFLAELLSRDEAIRAEGKEVCKITEKRGAMAGIPVSPFLANVYLMDVDRYFEAENVLYFRYSDDILLFADSAEELERYKAQLFERLEDNRLQINPSKLQEYQPAEAFEFLGFCFRQGEVDLAESTIVKIKGKIKRKAHALRRWQQKKNLPPERAAKGFIKAMNRKFFVRGDGNEFSWCRWFFPCLTSDEGLKEIDAYMQEYVRFCVTGRHYKGNYKVSYAQMKEWGYKSLVHEYYQEKKDMESGADKRYDL